MTTPMFSINGASEILERDRRTVGKALRHTPPDGKERGVARYRLKTIIDALSKMQLAPVSAPADQIDPQLARLYAEFDERDAAMRKLQTLDARRKAAVAMAPLIAEMDTLMREVGIANGQDPELVDLRSDKLFMLYLRGFEAPCAWSMSEVWDAVNDCKAGRKAGSPDSSRGILEGTRSERTP
jgi:hypothetical protein